MGKDIKSPGFYTPTDIAPGEYPQPALTTDSNEGMTTLATLEERIQNIVDDIEVVITIKAGTTGSKSIGTKTATKKILALIAAHDRELVASLKDRAQMFYFLGDNTTKYDAVRVEAIDAVVADFDPEQGKDGDNA